MTTPMFFQDHAGHWVEVYIKESTSEDIQFCNYRGRVIESDNLGLVLKAKPMYPLFVDDPPSFPEREVFIPWDRIGLVMIMDERM